MWHQVTNEMEKEFMNNDEILHVYDDDYVFTEIFHCNSLAGLSVCCLNKKLMEFFNEPINQSTPVRE